MKECQEFGEDLHDPSRRLQLVSISTTPSSTLSRTESMISRRTTRTLRTPTGTMTSILLSRRLSPTMRLRDSTVPSRNSSTPVRVRSLEHLSKTSELPSTTTSTFPISQRSGSKTCKTVCSSEHLVKYPSNPDESENV